MAPEPTLDDDYARPSLDGHPLEVTAMCAGIGRLLND